MKIALDAMGGDLAPRSPVVGTLQFLQDQTSGMEIILVGDQTILKEELGGSSYEEEIQEMRLRAKNKKWDEKK